MENANTIFFVIFFLFVLGVTVLMITAQWKLFQKAGREGWEAVIPIYNAYVYFEICGKPGWYAFLAFIPCIGSIILLVLYIIASLELAKRFGKTGGFGIGLFFLPFIFVPVLAFSDAVYNDDTNPVTNYLNEN